MSNFLAGLKIFIVSIIATVGALSHTTAHINSQNSTAVHTSTSSASESATDIIDTKLSTPNPSGYQISPKQSPLPLNGENYIYVQGTYFYLGQSIKYLFLVPKKGGSFSGVIDGACQAQIAGNYEGGNGGKISGLVGGSCNLFGMKIQGSTKFNGRLFPDNKTIKLDIDNSPIHGLVINYN